MPVRVVKLKNVVPYELENRMVNKWGYAIERRVPGDYILFKKSYVSDKGDDEGVKRTIHAPPVNLNNVVMLKDNLSTYQKKSLEKRCDNIVNFFPDPYSVPMSVRARLMTIMDKMCLAEAQFVLEYMDENFPIVDKGE